MRGNLHARFLGELATVMSPVYPTAIRHEVAQKNCLPSMRLLGRWMTKQPNAYQRLVGFFNELKASALLSFTECWEPILVKAMEKYQVKSGSGNPIGLPAPA